MVNQHWLEGCTELFIQNGLVIERVLRENLRLSNLSELSSLSKLILKLMVYLFFNLILLRLSYNFFLCHPPKEA